MADSSPYPISNNLLIDLLANMNLSTILLYHIGSPQTNL